MLEDFFSCLIGLLNLERNCSLANRTYKVQSQFLRCRVRRNFFLAIVFSHLYIYYIVFKLRFCFYPQSVLDKGIEVLVTRH